MTMIEQNATDVMTPSLEYDWLQLDVMTVAWGLSGSTPAKTVLATGCDIGEWIHPAADRHRSLGQPWTA